jgi:hypothetical protein
MCLLLNATSSEKGYGYGYGYGYGEEKKIWHKELLKKVKEKVELINLEKISKKVV